MEYNLTPEEENRDILRAYKKLLNAAKPVLKEGDTKIIKRAFTMAVDGHKEMRRKSGEPYIFHPIAVAQICVEEIGLGTTSIVAALLHDVVEDTDYTLEDIEKSFGKKVARIIDGLTKISGAFKDSEEKQAENFKKIALSLADDVRVILIKLADRLHNMRTMASMPHHKQIAISAETNYFYAPLAHRLGLYQIKSELEDLYLKYTHPEKYQEIKDKIEESENERKTFIREFIKPIQEKLRECYFEFKIKGRSKSIYSIWNKMINQGTPFEEVYDLFAIRIIVDAQIDQEKNACWQVYSVVTDFYRPNPGRLRDWISTPKSNGYESLHTTVMSHRGKWVEVQIRSERMDQVAEKGYAAHWKYKQKGDVDDSEKIGVDMWLNTVTDAIVSSQDSAKDFVNDFKSNLFNKEIYVFTPKGDLKILPRSSTVLDFAFEVHSKVGFHCIGAKINHHLVPVNHVLKNGDQIEIVTSEHQDPSEEWLKIAVTSKAKKKIKDYLNDHKKDLEVKGKEKLEARFQDFGLTLDKKGEQRLVNLFQVNSIAQIYYKVGTGAIDLRNLEKPEDLRKVVPRRKLLKNTKFSEEELKKSVLKNNILLVSQGKDDEGVRYSFASCCKPVRGDEIWGYLTSDQGVEVHRSECSKMNDYHKERAFRVVKAEWAPQRDDVYQVSFKLVGVDRKGVLNEITSTLYDVDVYIEGLNISTNQGIFYMNFDIHVKDLEHLNTIFNRMREVPNVLSVERIEGGIGKS